MDGDNMEKLTLQDYEAEGKVVRDAADAVGIVFKMEAIGSDVPAVLPNGQSL